MPTTDQKKGNKHLQELVQTLGKEAVEEIIEIYHKQTPLILQEINNNIHQDDFKKLSQLAHKLKSSSFSLGAEEIGNICLKIEELSLKTTPPKEEIFILCQKLLQEYEQSKNDLKSFL